MTARLRSTSARNRLCWSHWYPSPRTIRFSRIHPIGWSGGRRTVVRYIAITTASIPVLACAAHHHPGRRKISGGSDAVVSPRGETTVGVPVSATVYATQCRRVATMPVTTSRIALTHTSPLNIHRARPNTPSWCCSFNSPIATGTTIS